MAGISQSTVDLSLSNTYIQCTYVVHTYPTNQSQALVSTRDLHPGQTGAESRYSPKPYKVRSRRVRNTISNC
jgi:hypothetical protein